MVDLINTKINQAVNSTLPAIMEILTKIKKPLSILPCVPVNTVNTLPSADKAFLESVPIKLTISSSVNAPAAVSYTHLTLPTILRV